MLPAMLVGPRTVRALAGLAAGVLAAAALAGCGGAPPHALVVGAVEDAAKWDPPRASMELARRAGFRAIVLSSVWSAPQRAPSAAEIAQLRGAVDAADAVGIEPVVAVYSFAADTPTSARARGEFAAYAAAIVREIPELRCMSVGNEPNSGVFWMPQFGPDGSDAAAPAYFRLLSETYDLLRRIDPRLSVIGGSLAASGSDRPGRGKPSHSPTRFIEDLGSAFRASRRARPPLDLFSLHPYPANSSIPPTAAAPRSTSLGIADYGRLVALLTGAFGAPPPIVYGEYGIETTIPAAKRGLYAGHRPANLDPVSAARQAGDYIEAIDLAACQPLVRMLLFFHVTDESRLTGLQTGLFYPDDTPKPSLVPVARWAGVAEAGTPVCAA